MMSLTQRLSNYVVNLETDAACGALNGGKIRIYDGSQPATADTEVGSQHLLVELTLPSPAFGAAVAGVATANTIPQGTIIYTGTATWFRVLKSDNTKHHDGSVGVSGANCNLDSVELQVNAKCTINSFTFTAQKS